MPLLQFLLQEVIAGGAGVAGAVQVAQEHSEEALRLLEVEAIVIINVVTCSY